MKATDRGWAWMIVVGNTIINLSVLPVQQCFGLIFEQRFSAIGISATQASLILHLNGTITCSLGLINGPMMKKFTFRKVALFGSLIVVTGICLTAFSVSLVTLILSYCLFVGIGQGIVYPATSLAMNTYFRKKRKLAMGLTVTLTALGPIIMPLLIAKLLDAYATTGAILILGGIAAHSFVGALLLKPMRNSAEKNSGTTNDDGETPLKNDIPTTRSNDIDNTNCSTNVHVPSQLLEQENQDKKQPKPQQSFFKKITKNMDLELLKDNRFLVVIIGMGISTVAETNFNAMIPFVLRELSELNIPTIAKVMSIQAIADIAGRFCVPLIAQKTGWSSRSLYVVSLLGSTCARALLTTWGNQYSMVIAVSLFVGISKGTKAVFQTLIIPDYVPLERLPAASGMMMVFNGILSIAVGPLIGLVHDSTNSYIGALYFTSSLSVSCVVLWLLWGLWIPLNRRSEDSLNAEKVVAV